MALLDSFNHLKEVQEENEKDEDSDNEESDGHDDVEEEDDDDEDSEDEQPEETEEEFLDRYAKAASELENEMIAEGDVEDDEQEIDLALVPLSEISDPSVMRKYGVKTDAEALDILNTVSRQKQVIIVMKIYWGDAREKICEAIDNIPLSCLVIGNRGLSKIKRVFMGSVSNFVVNNGACPVTVVKSVEHNG